MTLESGQKTFEYLSKSNSQCRTLFAKRMIQIALERDSVDREACIAYFKEAYINDLIKKEEIRRGFDLIYIDLDEILIDNPHAIEHLMHMLLRIVYDAHLFTESFFIRLPDILLNLQT